jgi:acyl-CoA reductase-like NAD-dependent aldehyde dehydrogenase
VIVCNDADIQAVVDGVRAYGYYNAGQDCTACRITGRDSRRLVVPNSARRSAACALPANAMPTTNSAR